MNTELANKLISMADEDKRLIHQLHESGELPSKDYPPILKAVHEKNITDLKKIIVKYGWPGILLVGEKEQKRHGSSHSMQCQTQISCRVLQTC